MDESRRHAQAWAEEWRLRKRNRRIVTIVVAVIAVIVVFGVIGYMSNYIPRMKFNSEEEMKAAAYRAHTMSGVQYCLQSARK